MMLYKLKTEDIWLPQLAVLDQPTTQRTKKSSAFQKGAKLIRNRDFADSYEVQFQVGVHDKQCD